MGCSGPEQLESYTRVRAHPPVYPPVRRAGRVARGRPCSHPHISSRISGSKRSINNRAAQLIDTVRSSACGVAHACADRIGIMHMVGGFDFGGRSALRLESVGDDRSSSVANDTSSTVRPWSLSLRLGSGGYAEAVGGVVAFTEGKPRGLKHGA